MSESSKRIQIAVLADLHYGDPGIHPTRRTDISDLLLLRAVRRLNQFIKPDVTVVLGDILETSSLPASEQQLRRLREILDHLKSPWIIIPGNHDWDEDAFYKIFPRPDEIMEIAGGRFLPFLDKQEPEYNASRTEKDIARFHAARRDFSGPIVSLQHVALGPREKIDTWFNYINEKQITEAARQAGVTLCLSGHAHVIRHVEDQGTHYIVAPALNEAPFRYLLVTLDRTSVAMEEQSLAMPPELELSDWHIHTQFAYCGENMNIQRAVGLAWDFGLARIGIVEHSPHLYFGGKRFFEWIAYREGFGARKEGECRAQEYLAAVAPFRGDRVRCGFELDCDRLGHPLLAPDDRAQGDFSIGSVHWMDCLEKPDLTLRDVAIEHRARTEEVLAQDVTIFGHPFRSWMGRGIELPEEEMRSTARLLKRHGVAAEINFHNIDAPEAFMRICLEEGVKLALGSDSHNLCDIGEFYPHLRLLQKLGVNDLDKVLLK